MYSTTESIHLFDITGKSYFFKRNYFWEFEDATVALKDGRPQETKSYWFNC